MAKIIFTTNYYRSPSHSKTGNLLKYIGTREGVEKLPSGIDDSPATVRQLRLIADIEKNIPSVLKTGEYKKYIDAPTKTNATNFIDWVIKNNDIQRLDKLVNYVAERPGVEKLGSHGLFTQTDEKIDLNAVADEINNHKGIVWTHVVSLRREDAERLGYDNAQAWKDLVRRSFYEIAEAHNISPSNLQWYAGFHNTDYHPHMHLMVYAKDGKEGWITKNSIDDMRSLFGNDIFRNEQYKIFKMQTQQRDLVKKKVHEMLEDVSIYQGVDFKMQELFLRLNEQLENCSGKKVYGYLPESVKKNVNEIVKEYAKDKDIAQLYSEWNKLNREKLSLYYESKDEPDIPLEHNKEFRSIKNDIVKAALEMSDNSLTTGASKEDSSAMAYYYVVCSLLTLFQTNNDKKEEELNRQVDNKLLQKISRKKKAQGLRTGGPTYVKKKDYEQSM